MHEEVVRNTSFSGGIAMKYQFIHSFINMSANAILLIYETSAMAVERGDEKRTYLEHSIVTELEYYRQLNTLHKTNQVQKFVTAVVIFQATCGYGCSP